ncbi:hypothetical protein BURMUCGD2M_6404 [Burkholderia multivorans CGD2M]|uniref:Uncharacterized protein n=1 Tax=Burkholderia multivorans CGD2 TaxID=513052 RepID=B9BNZ5_9BURK|nr:hypothetical protein BURMUCGD2_6415 [Burkholderia multivorans CGD2]EEE13683.1 hypothetical protein BURMUCGD2M_6404 [Burkholderia multivorans CGD2M]
MPFRSKCGMALHFGRHPHLLVRTINCCFVKPGTQFATN